MVAGAGRGLRGSLGHRLRRRPGVHRDRAPGQACPGVLDRARRHATDGQTDGDGGHARRVHRPHDHGPREPRLPHRATGRRSVEQQAALSSLGALRLEAGARSEGDLDRRRHRPRRQEGCDRDGGGALRQVLGRLPAALLDRRFRCVPVRLLKPDLPVRERGQATPAPARQLVHRLPRRAHGLPLIPGGDHGQPLGVPVLRRVSGRQGARLASWDGRATRQGRRGRTKRGQGRSPRHGGPRWWRAVQHESNGGTRSNGRDRRTRHARPDPRPQPGLRPEEPQRNGVLLPASGVRRRGEGEAGVHHARGVDAMEVPRLRP